MNTFMADYLARLEEMRAVHRAEHAKQQAADQKHQPPVPPLDYLGILRDWWASMPPRTRQHPWSLEIIAAAAFKDQSRRPAPRRVAEALRQLGFTEKRDWTRAGRNRRHWLPPAEII